MRLECNSLQEIEFYPLDDVAGFTYLESVTINGRTHTLADDLNSYQYMKKNSGHYTFPVSDIEKLDVEVIWNYKRIFDYLNS